MDCNLHPALYSLHTALHHAPGTLHPVPFLLHPTPYTMPCTLRAACMHPSPGTLHPHHVYWEAVSASDSVSVLGFGAPCASWQSNDEVQEQGKSGLVLVGVGVTGAPENWGGV